MRGPLRLQVGLYSFIFNFIIVESYFVKNLMYYLMYIFYLSRYHSLKLYVFGVSSIWGMGSCKGVRGKVSRGRVFIPNKKIVVSNQNGQELEVHSL